MPLVKLDARLAELAFLDVVSVRPDGSLYLDGTFVAKCLAAYGADPSAKETLVRDQILERARELRHAPRAAPGRLAAAAMTVGGRATT